MSDGAEARARRRAHERAGRRAEWLAGAYLRLAGYRIVARRFRAHAGEIDIIARRGGVLAFIEVKARARLDDAVGAVSAKARRRIERAADMFMARNAAFADLAMRYDIFAVGGRRMVHLRDAWRCGE